MSMCTLPFASQTRRHLERGTNRRQPSRPWPSPLPRPTESLGITHQVSSPDTPNSEPVSEDTAAKTVEEDSFAGASVAYIADPQLHQITANVRLVPSSSVRLVPPHCYRR